MRKTLRLLFLATALAAAGACTTTQRVKTEKALATALISDEQENQLGEQVHRELEQKGIRYINDPAVTSYVDSVTSKILSFAKKDRPNVNWHVHVIDDPKQVNAFATPGGHLYVFSGLLLTADTEAELAGVLAHEAGHVVARHSARQMVQAFGLETVAGLALGENPNRLAAIATQLAGTGALLAFSRSDEKEADEYGARYSANAGYDPNGIIHFFEKLQAQQGKTPKILTFLQTHPATSDRIAAIQQYIAANRLSGTDVGAERLAPIKQRLMASAGGAPTGQP